MTGTVMMVYYLHTDQSVLASVAIMGAMAENNKKKKNTTKTHPINQDNMKVILFCFFKNRSMQKSVSILV